MAEDTPCDYLFKIVLIGDSGVGKSCLLMRFADDSFSESYISTIGVDFRFRTVQVPLDDGSMATVKTQLWDTAGQERFRTITSAYYKNSDAIMLVYDATNRESFNHVEDWLAEVERFADSRACRMLLGNKSDLPNPQVTREEAEALAEKLELPFLETSAKTAANVEAAFLMLAKELVEQRQAEEKENAAKEKTKGTVSLDGKGGKRNGRGGNQSCCK